MEEVDSSVYLAAGAVVTGEVSLGAHSSVWHNAVLRGDIAPIAVGERTNIQDCAVLHGAAGFPVRVGNGVTIGHGAIVHGCTVGNNTLVGMGAIVLNGASVGSDCIVGAGALVTQGMVIADGSVAYGSPARVVRPVTEEERAANRANAETYVRLATCAANEGDGGAAVCARNGRGCDAFGTRDVKRCARGCASGRECGAFGTRDAKRCARGRASGRGCGALGTRDAKMEQGTGSPFQTARKSITKNSVLRIAYAIYLLIGRFRYTRGIGVARRARWSHRAQPRRGYHR